MVRDDDKYFNLIKYLPPDIVNEMQDVLESLPFGYLTLKQALFSKFVIGNREKLNKFFAIIDIGHKKPEFLQFLFANGGSIFDREAILKIRSERLPAHISLHLTDEITLANEQKLRDRADEIHLKYLTSPNLVNSITNNLNIDPALESKLEQLVISKVDKYNSKFDASAQNYNRKNSNYQNRSFQHRNLRSRSKSPSASHRYNQNYSNKNNVDRKHSAERVNSNFNDSNSETNNLCYYHERYRSRAHRCQPPCTWRDRSRSPSGSRRVAFEQTNKSPSKNLRSQT